MTTEKHSDNHPLAGKGIVIAGAGIAGLSFARALSRSWPEDVPKPRVTLYERRCQKVSPQREGYSMSIRSDRMSGGMQALQKLDLINETLAASITGQHGGRGTFRVWNVDWKPILVFKQPKTPPDGLPANGMRIARYVLRQKLIDGIPSDCEVHWGVGCESAEKLGDGRMRVALSDGTTTECDLLVAADGSNSKIRASLRPSDELEYAGAVSISASSRFPDGLPEHIKEDHGLVLGAGPISLFVSPIDDTSATWSISYLSPTPREGLSSAEVHKAKREIMNEARELGKPYGEIFRQLIDATDPATLLVFNCMDKQPIKHSELADIPVVFIGDSNHAVSPFAGNGANMALMDGLDLADELCAGKDLRAALNDFDKKSMTRSQRTVSTSHWVIAIVHSNGWRLALWKIFLHFINFLMSF